MKWVNFPGCFRWFWGKLFPPLQMVLVWIFQIVCGSFERAFKRFPQVNSKELPCGFLVVSNGHTVSANPDFLHIFLRISRYFQLFPNISLYFLIFQGVSQFFLQLFLSNYSSPNYKPHEKLSSPPERRAQSVPCREGSFS